MRHGWTVAAGLVLLAGCGQSGNRQAFSDDAVAVEMIAPAAPADPGAAPVPASSPVTAPSVAYVYRYALELPADRTTGLMVRHEQDCAAAGPAVCQIVGSDSSRHGRDSLNAHLEIRATPVWIARFRNALAGQAEAAGGRIASSATESEDLTRQLVDTEARLRAQTTLRDRLQQLLATRNGSLEELLKVERELAQVQGDIDSIQSNLAVMHTRVATSRLNIEYRSEGLMNADSVFQPVVAALNGALAAFMTTVGVLITIAAVVLPIVLIGAPLLWLFLRRRRTLTRARTPAGDREAAQAARVTSPET
jgi:hypothetical protein